MHSCICVQKTAFCRPGHKYEVTIPDLVPAPKADNVTDCIWQSNQPLDHQETLR